AFRRSALWRSASLRSTCSSACAAVHAFQAATPLLGIASCSPLAMGDPFRAQTWSGPLSAQTTAWWTSSVSLLLQEIAATAGLEGAQESLDGPRWGAVDHARHQRQRQGPATQRGAQATECYWPGDDARLPNRSSFPPAGR